MQSLDPHQRPPDGIRAVYKKYQKMKPAELDTDLDILDLKLDSHTALPEKVHVVKDLQIEHLNEAFRTFAGDDSGSKAELQSSASTIAVYEHDDMPGEQQPGIPLNRVRVCQITSTCMPINISLSKSNVFDIPHRILTKVGLHFIPSLLPPEVQSILLFRLLHRDLSSPSHLTNIHTHYNLSYPLSSPSSSHSSSFFTHSPSSSIPIATPLNPSIHKPLTISQLLNKKLRWTTLGGQYDWTAKRYPDTPPPPFPSDIKTLLESIFTETKVEAAIVNLYSPGDTLSVHRDVAESSPHGLVSVSLGCDAVFVIGHEDRTLVLRLRSGSVVYMSGDARFAWHGVPQIVGGTGPDYLADWPAGSGDAEEYEEWRGWMRGKRVNLNVRQMWD